MTEQSSGGNYGNPNHGPGDTILRKINFLQQDLYELLDNGTLLNYQTAIDTPPTEFNDLALARNAALKALPFLEKALEGTRFLLDELPGPYVDQMMLDYGALPEPPPEPPPEP